jgi:hypothetical protein
MTAPQHLSYPRTSLDQAGVRVGAVQPRQSNDHVQSIVGKPPTRFSFGNLLRPPAIQFGIRRIAEPQLDSGSELIL